MLWLYYCGETIAAIMKGVRMTRKSVARTTGSAQRGGGGLGPRNGGLAPRTGGVWSCNDASNGGGLVLQ
ncbi:MAG: hypothetical protein L0Y43_11530, partial [Methylococcaceae bacterium]|nr:hypothetical protein [Methylococcaceae bacterium]